MIPTPPHARSTLIGLRCRMRALVCLEQFSFAPPTHESTRWMPACAGMTAKHRRLRSFPRKRESRSWYTHLQCALGALVLSTSAVAADQAAVVPPTADETILFQEIPSVFSASKYEQKITEAPSAVTLISAEEIRTYGYRTLADVLRSVLGFYVTDDRNYSYLGIRGFNRPGDYNTRVLLQVDGHRLNDNIYDQAALGTEAVLDVDLIDRIEIIRGPSSSLYGTNAFFGVINVVTKRGRDIQGTELSTALGSYDSYKGRLTYGNRFANGLEVLLSGAFYDSEGRERLFFKEFASPLTNNGIARRGDDDRAYNLFGTFSFHDFILQGGYVYREKGVPTAPFGSVFNTTRSRSVDEHGYADLRYTHTFAEHWQLTTRFYGDYFYYRGDFLFDSAIVPAPPDPPTVLNQDLTTGAWWGGEGQLTKRVLDRHLLTAGLEYRDDFRQEQKNADQDPPASFLNSKEDGRNWALFLQDEFTILDGLLLNAGVRYDHYDTFGGTTNPRLALIYNRKQTTFKLLYGEAFRAPSAYEQFYGGAFYKRNPRLQPENIKTYELVIEQAFNHHARGMLSVYHYDIDDLIGLEQDPADDLLVYRNADQITAHGIEMTLDYHISNRIEGRISYALQRAVDERRNTALSNSPRHLLTYNLIVAVLPETLFAGLEARYMSGRKTLAGNTASDFAVVNATLFSQKLFAGFASGLELSVGVVNLFDREYDDPASTEHRQEVIEQNGRTVWMKMKYAF